jgi:hypothetical protein
LYRKTFTLQLGEKKKKKKKKKKEAKLLTRVGFDPVKNFLLTRSVR